MLRRSHGPLPGLEDQAAAFARRMIAIFEAADVDTIVVNAAGCGSTS